MSTLTFTTLDVFTTTRYAGNPLAVVRIPHDHGHVSNEQMQRIAREFNLSETVFIHENTDTGSEIPEWVIRIFFPTAELPFAGHPVIGTAVHALGTLAKGAKKGRFICNAGPVELDFDTTRQLAQASIPHNFHRHTDIPFTPDQVYELQPKLKSAGVAAKSIETLSPVKGMNFVSVELPSLEALGMVYTSGVAPNPTLDADWNVGFSGSYYYVIVDEGSGTDGRLSVRTRMIEGTLEDPATGSAACALSCFLALKFKFGKTTDLALTQGVEMGRQSDIRVKVTLGGGDPDRIEKVELIGSAVPVMEGNIWL